MDKVCNAKIMFLVFLILSSLNLCDINVFLAIDIKLEFERIKWKHFIQHQLSPFFCWIYFHKRNMLITYKVAEKDKIKIS